LEHNKKEMVRERDGRRSDERTAKNEGTKKRRERIGIQECNP
jgi:hypothetical protein